MPKQILINQDDDGRVSVQSNVNNIIELLGLFEFAQGVVRDKHMESQRGGGNKIEPASLVMPPNFRP